jgi:hypothetical protein
MWYSAVGCIGALTLSLLVAPLTAEAQPPGKVCRIGYLRGRAPDLPDPFRQGLHALGYVEGQNIVLE